MHTRNTPPPPRKKTVARKAAGLTPGQVADRLHSSACQTLSAARFLIGAIKHRLPQDATDVRQELKEVDGLLDKTCAELRELTKELRIAAEKDSPV